MAEIIFHPDTAHEIKSSYEWYQNQAEGLEKDFIAELESAMRQLQNFPEHGLNLNRYGYIKPIVMFLSWLSCITAESRAIGKVAQ